jgi:hypothetical protein
MTFTDFVVQALPTVIALVWGFGQRIEVQGLREEKERRLKASKQMQKHKEGYGSVRLDAVLECGFSVTDEQLREMPAAWQFNFAVLLEQIVEEYPNVLKERADRMRRMN